MTQTEMSFEVPDTFVDHALWEEVAPYVKIQYATERNPDRLELMAQLMPRDLLNRAMGAEVKCPHCNRPTHQFRLRVKGQGDRVQNLNAVYMAMTCPQDVRKGCSKGNAARSRRELYIEELEGMGLGEGTGPLPT
jgi:hypothetical protein